jgi:superfamily I DNA/RNA helicase
MRMLNGTISALVDGKTTAERADWGHLILDEGQDFAPDAYCCLRMVADHLESLGHQRPAVSVFADENQRLTHGKNSSLQEIQQALCLDAGASGRVFSLKKNYRNTRPIAEFASHFFVGLASGKPDLPSSAGRKPTMYFAERVEDTAALEAVRRTIATYAMNNAGKDVGVLCASDRMRKKLFNSMTARLADTGLRVQTYSYKEREEHPAEKLEFDTGNCVTLLNFQSAKGLEFDTVFIIDPFEALSMGGSDEQRFKMQMYVMSTRARKELYVFVLTQPPRADLLPPEHLYVRTTL